MEDIMSKNPIGTFNCEDLFARFLFKGKKVELEMVSTDGRQVT
jgi:hypothetical protein